jgi:hypothetical protein
MNSNHINSWAVEGRVGKVLTSTNALGTGNTASDDSDTAFSQTNGLFEMGCNVTKPGLSCDDGRYAGPGLILDIDSLNKIRKAQICRNSPNKPK